MGLKKSVVVFGKYYDSVRNACKALNISYHTVQSAVKAKKYSRSGRVGNFTFKDSRSSRKTFPHIQTDVRILRSKVLHIQQETSRRMEHRKMFKL